ncbi:hypothetical protein BaRGS_00025728, partial [Batillaria attramentaria]
RLPMHDVPQFIKSQQSSSRTCIAKSTPVHNKHQALIAKSWTHVRLRKSVAETTLAAVAMQYFLQEAECLPVEAGE